MNNELLPHLLRGLTRMQVENPHAYEQLVSFITDKKTTLLDGLVIANDTIQVHRAQGGIKILAELLEVIDKPNELLHSIEQNLS